MSGEKGGPRTLAEEEAALAKRYRPGADDRCDDVWRGAAEVNRLFLLRLMRAGHAPTGISAEPGTALPRRVGGFLAVGSMTSASGWD